MKRVFLLIVVPALLVAMGFAQTPAAGGNTDQINIQGCLSGSEGNYNIAEDNTGKILRITSSTADLKAYEGQDVILIGHKAGTADNGIAVTEVKMITEHCAGAAAAPAAAVSAPADTNSTPPAAAAAPAATASAPAETVSTPAAATSTLLLQMPLSACLRRMSAHHRIWSSNVLLRRHLPLRRQLHPRGQSVRPGRLPAQPPRPRLLTERNRPPARRNRQQSPLLSLSLPRLSANLSRSRLHPARASTRLRRLPMHLHRLYLLWRLQSPPRAGPH